MGPGYIKLFPRLASSTKYFAFLFTTVRVSTESVPLIYFSIMFH